MNLSELLAKIDAHPEIKIEKRVLPDGTTVYIFSNQLPAFPKLMEPRWYPLVVKPGQAEIKRGRIEALLRHLWQFQIDLFDETEH